MRKTGPTNPRTISLVSALKKKAIEENIQVWKRLATELEKPTRSRRIVNISRLNRFTQADELVVVPGKILAGGIINHKITVAALAFSDDAAKKIKQAGGSTLLIEELMKKSNKVSTIRIIG